MGYESKEEKVLELFYNEPTKHWHFKELREKSKLPDSKLAKWLSKFQKEKLILRIKPQNKMPYYISNYQNSFYQNRKKLFAMTKLCESGILDHIASLNGIKTAIIFGSFVRWDWYRKSDIDLFIYGNDDDFDMYKYQIMLHREIQVFVAKDENELKKLGSGLLNNILMGSLVKGGIPLEMIRHAAREEPNRSV